jgi:hypothetical protein
MAGLVILVTIAPADAAEVVRLFVVEMEKSGAIANLAAPSLRCCLPRERRDGESGQIGTGCLCKGIRFAEWPLSARVMASPDMTLGGAQ